MNIYQHYHANGNKFGFLVKKKDWAHLTAKVVSIDTVTEGDRIRSFHGSKNNGNFDKRRVRVVLYGPGCFSKVEITLGRPWDQDFKLIQEPVKL